VRKDGVSDEDRRLFNLGDEWADRPVYEADKGGCSECRESGYSGRTALLEIIPITPKTSDMLSKGEISPYDLEVMIQEEGKLPNLRRSGLKLLVEGKTDLLSVSKVIDMTYNE
jgi:type II secretory ATPase GspE/PulE/Tfp pilus assembly ATPase PilB-like protein